MSFLSGITEMPWLVTAPPTDDSELPLAQPKRTGLMFFLFVVSSIFFLFIAAYLIRMDYGDWRPLADSRILWLNTLVLLAGSIAFQSARNASQTDQHRRTLLYLSIAGFLTLLFLSGQLWVWSQIYNAGYPIRGNPANAFFYLLTGAHGLHLVGGLYVWFRTLLRAVSEPAAASIKLSVELCSVYWHYLLLVWLLLFGLLLAT